MRSTPRRSRVGERGFIISLEFLLVMALVVLPLMVAFTLLGRKLITVYLNQREAFEQPYARAVIWDSTNPGPVPTPKPVGQVMGYDQYGAPLLLFRDAPASAAPPGTGAGFILGVRPNRLTTVSSVYYDGANCTGNVFLKSAAAPSALPWANVAFNSQLAGLTYAIGDGNRLYRAAIPVVAAADLTAGSVWISEDARDGSPASTPSTACVPLSTAPKVMTSLADEGSLTVTAVTLTNHELHSGDFVTIAGAVSIPGPDNYNGTFVVTVTGSNTFTYTRAAASGAPSAIVLLASAIFNRVPNLVASAVVIDFDGAGNYVTPFRMAFPTPGPLTPIVPGSGG